MKKLGAEYPKHPRIGVRGIIIDKKRILLIKRRAEPNRGFWSIPGGNIKLGERLIDAVEREVEEETGLKVRAIKIEEISEMIKRDRDGRVKYHYIIIDYRTRILEGRLKAASDAQEAGWFTSKKAEELKISNITKRLLKKLTKKGEIE